MATGPATAERPEAPLFADGLGERVVAVDAATGDLLQILRVRPQLLQVIHDQALRHDARVAELEQIIGRQTCELEVLKKASRLLTGPPARNGRSS